jgi:hypothetical protein
MEAHGIDRQSAAGHIESWAVEDYYPPLFAELQLLREAGFEEPECFWRSGAFSVFGAVRSA